MNSPSSPAAALLIRIQSYPQALIRFKNLQKLFLGENHFDTFPERIVGLNNLQVLILIDNQLTALPPEILDLEIKWEYDFRSGVYLENNPLESPPIEIIKRGREAVANYFNEIRRELENLNKDFISYEHFLELCKTHGLDEERADFLGDYYHDLGVFLHFRDSVILENTLVLKPEWGTAAVYDLLDDPEVRENQGHFGLETIHRVWQKYPRDKAVFTGPDGKVRTEFFPGYCRR